MELWNIQKGMSSNDGPDSSGEGRCNCLPFDNPSAPITIQSQLREGQVRTERAAPVSTRNSVLLPAIPGVTQDSSGVTRMDQVESGARQVLRPQRRQLGLPLRHPTGGQGHSHCSASLYDKRHIGSSPDSFFAICPDISALQGPLEAEGESQQPKMVFFTSPLSLLASSIKFWLL